MTGMPQETYYSLLKSIENNEQSDMDELHAFLKNFPVKLRN